jgi:hypothetical protein
MMQHGSAQLSLVETRFKLCARVVLQIITY